MSHCGKNCLRPWIGQIWFSDYGTINPYIVKDTKIKSFCRRRIIFWTFLNREEDRSHAKISNKILDTTTDKLSICYDEYLLSMAVTNCDGPNVFPFRTLDMKAH